MGGTPPLGYRPDGRSLAIVEEHAEIIRDVYRRYLDLGSVRTIEQQLNREGRLSPRRARISGREFGGLPLSRGSSTSSSRTRSMSATSRTAKPSMPDNISRLV